jgi:acyl-CoA synthetase (NDP forming)
MHALLKLGIPVYPSPERAVRALAALRKASCGKTETKPGPEQKILTG